MKRTFAFILIGLVAAVLFAVFVPAIVMATHLSEPAANTVQGLTPRRLWATTVAVLALIAVVIGSLALRQSGRIGRSNVGMRPIVALVAGLIAVVNGALNLTMATGGPGTGNGVIGGAAALVLGLIGMVLGGLALARSRHPHHSAS